MVKIFEFILVYPLHLSVFFSYILSFLQFYEQDSQLVHMSYYMAINYCHINYLIPILAL